MKGSDILKRLGFAPRRSPRGITKKPTSTRGNRKKMRSVVQTSQRRNRPHKRSRRARLGARHA